MEKKECLRMAPVDRISNLPDEILCHIISFLPTKFAFSSTIILSKRWNQLFKLLTAFNFDDEDLQSEHHFLQFLAFIDKITLSTQLIKTIHLNFSSIHRHHFNIHRWIESAKRHPLENLNLLCSYTHRKKLIIPLPSTIFTLFPTLVVLKLSMLNVISDITLVHLPSLKTLHLTAVYFKNKHSFNNLLYQCPVLEELVAASIFFRRKDEEETEGREFKSLSNLNTAHMDLVNSPHVPFRAICNVHILKLKMMAMLSGFLVFQNLINLHLSFYNFKDWDDLVEILQYCPKLQILQLIKRTTNKHMSISWKYPNYVPQCIASHLKSCTIDYEGLEDELRFTKYILQNAPLLELMKINLIHPLTLKPKQQNTLQQLYSCPRISTQCKLSISEPVFSRKKIRLIGSCYRSM